MRYHNETGMPRSRELILCFKDTIDCCEKYRDLEFQIRQTQNSCVVYKDSFTLDRQRKYSDTICEILIEEKTPFDVASGCIGEHTALIYFGDPALPGGKTAEGGAGQEESLCRSSSLWRCLDNDRAQKQYYRYNQNRPDACDRILFLPEVTVIKDDSPFPSLLEEKDWFSLDVITAPGLGDGEPGEFFDRSLFRQRLSAMMDVALENGARKLVVAPMDCGTSDDAARMMATCFYEVITGGQYHRLFSQIAFAMKPNAVEKSYAAINTFRLKFHAEEPSTERLKTTDVASVAEAVEQRSREYILSGPLQADPVAACFDQRDFLKWRLENPYYGKSFSIIGDSNSTFAGFVPTGTKAFYPNEEEQNDVASWMDTWWGRVIDFFGGRLLFNSSWQDRRVSDDDSLAPAGCSSAQCYGIREDDGTPDVIMIHMGMNDWISGVPVEMGGENGSFRSNYRRMLRTLRSQFPDTEIWCCSIPKTTILSNPRFKFPHVYGGIHINEYNSIIHELAEENRCRIIDLYSYPSACDTLDGIHLTAAGMWNTAMIVCRTVAGPEASYVWNCPDEDHDYARMVTLFNGPSELVCRKCGVSKESVLARPKAPAEKPPVQEPKPQPETPPRKSGAFQRQTDVTPAISGKQAEWFAPGGNTPGMAAPQEPEQMPELKLLDTSTGAEHVFRNCEKINLGRDAMTCQIVVNKSYVSRVHLRFVYSDHCWSVVDNNSSNGTWLNGERIWPEQKHPLSVDDRITLSQKVTFCVLSGGGNPSAIPEAPSSETQMFKWNWSAEG